VNHIHLSSILLSYYQNIQPVLHIVSDFEFHMPIPLQLYKSDLYPYWLSVQTPQKYEGIEDDDLLICDVKL
jgi:hypothetical protein